jgi:hypothetical protein
LCNFRPEFSNHQQLQNLPMPHLLVWSLLLLSFKDHHLHWHLPLICHLQKKHWWINL